MTRTMTADSRRVQMYAPACTAEAACFYSETMYNYAAIITMGTSTLVSIFVMAAVSLRLCHISLTGSIAILISIICLLLSHIPPKETSDLS